MDPQALLTADAGGSLGRSRARVLDLLREAGSPVGVREVAERTGLHPNTARFHLQALAEAGLATREPQSRDTPGRPSMGYRSAGGGPAGQRRYRLLAEMLASLVRLSIPEPAVAAREAGREWGAFLTGQPPPRERPEAGEAVARLAATLAGLGFAVEVEQDGARYRVCLRECPFLEVARHHLDVVCSLHLGLMRGALAQMRAPVTAERLVPFEGPDLCVAHIEPLRPARPAS